MNKADERTEVKRQFAEWAILELMGHRRLVGFVSEVEIGGAGLLRIDVPSEPPLTQYYSPGAIYCLTPTTEKQAREIAATMHPAPIHRFELPPAIKAQSTYDGLYRDDD